MWLELGIALVGAAGAFVAWKLRQIRKRDIKLAAKAAYLAQVTKPAVERPPNIVLVLCDDLGFADVGCFGAIAIKTPNVDELARQGMKLTSCYASAPICSPSRAGLLTGRYGIRGHVAGVFFPSGIISLAMSPFFYSMGMKGLAPDEVTIAEVLRKAGYRTGMVGKWHLGDRHPHLPSDFGFDLFYGAHYSNDMKPYRIYRNDEVEVPAPADQDTLTQHLTREAVAFIDSSVQSGSPFFLYYAQPFPHTPLHASDAFRGKSRAGLYGDAVEELDWSVGEVVAALKRHGIFENTLFIFTSDNGPWHEGNPGYQRGRKYLPFEGGSRIPMIACWPARIPPGTASSAQCSHLDLFPTILSQLGIPLPADRVIDGRDISGLLADPSSQPIEHPFHYLIVRRMQAIRRGKWKYHTRHASDNGAYFMLHPGPFLFDLETDPQESYNQIKNHPDVADELAGELARFNASLKRNQRGWLLRE
ncbi:MAG: sulfatase [Candidatus Lokiarchaeota archaeon]|nr:sulfatase [Candidatus Lokiarchaeota archaeon]